MSLINFPDVPNLPGVPAIPRSPSFPTLAPTQTTSVTNPLPPLLTQWGFVLDSGEVPIVPDSFVDFEYREERKIPNYPVEGGSFASYNKVALPFDVKVTVSCNGKGQMTKEDFLNAIENLISSLTLVNVITPNATYNNCNLIHYDYRRESKQGVSLLIVALSFQEVKIAQSSIPTTTEPSGAYVQNNGQTSSVDLDATQEAQIVSPQDFLSSITANLPSITGLNSSLSNVQSTLTSTTSPLTSVLSGQLNPLSNLSTQATQLSSQLSSEISSISPNIGGLLNGVPLNINANINAIGCITRDINKITNGMAILENYNNVPLLNSVKAIQSTTNGIGNLISLSERVIQ